MIIVIKEKGTCFKELFIANVCAVCGCMQFAELAFVSV